MLSQRTSLLISYYPSSSGLQKNDMVMIETKLLSNILANILCAMKIKKLILSSNNLHQTSEHILTYLCVCVCVCVYRLTGCYCYYHISRYHNSITSPGRVASHFSDPWWLPNTRCRMKSPVGQKKFCLLT